MNTFEMRGQRIIDSREDLIALCKEMIETLRDELRERRSMRDAIPNQPFKYSPFGPVNRAWTLDKWKKRLGELE